ncbi:autotransporter domain-containing protein [Rhodobacterales bacterium]|nr:autotransporter domain-containing protein [Rhodobacterales bacterium]
MQILSNAGAVFGQCRSRKLPALTPQPLLRSGAVSGSRLQRFTMEFFLFRVRPVVRRKDRRTPLLGSLALVFLLPAGAMAATPVVGTAGTDGTSIGLNDTPQQMSTSIGLNGATTDLTTLPSIDNGDQFAVTINGTTTITVTVYTGETLQDLAAKIDALDGVRATATTTGTNDKITITTENVNTAILIADVNGIPIHHLGFAALPGSIGVVSTAGGDGTSGGDARQTDGSFDGINFGDNTYTGGNGGDGGTTAYNLTATDGGDAGDGGDGFQINDPFKKIELRNTSTVVAGGNGGEGGAGSGGGNDGADGDGGIGIHLVGAGLGAVEIVNHGTISGGLSGDGVTRNYAIYLENSGNTLRMFSGSALNGNVYLGTSGGALSLEGTGSEDAGFAGVGTLSLTSGSTWTLSGAIAPNTGGLSVATAASSTLTLTGTVSGDDLSKSGNGTLVFGSTGAFSNAITVTAGTLKVNGITGAVTLNGGMLGGSGTVGTLRANAGSTIAPGNSIGTLNVSGDSTLAAGSTYAVEVDRNGNSDRLAATGEVSIGSGVTLSISAENGTDDGSTYFASTAYTIITAGTGVSGRFSSVDENFAFLDSDVDYGDKSVTLTLTRNASSFSSAAQTPNQRATADGLASTGSGNAAYDAVVVLSETGAREAFNDLSGEIFASINPVLLQNARFTRITVGNRIRGAFDSVASADQAQFAFHGSGEAAPLAVADGLAAWATGYGGWGTIDSDENAARTNYTTGGTIVGADTDMPGGWRAGLFAGIGTSHFDVPDRSSSGTATSYTFGAYAGNRFGAVGARLGAGLGLHDVGTSRHIRAGSFSANPKADYLATTGQLFGELGYAVDAGATRIEPFLGAALIHQNTPGFSEDGGAEALTSGSSTQVSGTATLGVRAERRFALRDDRDILLEGSVGWEHGIGDLTGTAALRLDGGDIFEVTGAPVDRNVFQIGTGLSLALARDARLGLTYDGQFATSTQTHTLNARLSARF